jgi:hypothetical protein
MAKVETRVKAIAFGPNGDRYTVTFLKAQRAGQKDLWQVARVQNSTYDELEMFTTIKEAQIALRKKVSGGTMVPTSSIADFQASQTRGAAVSGSAAQ